MRKYVHILQKQQYARTARCARSGNMARNADCSKPVNLIVIRDRHLLNKTIPLQLQLNLTGAIVITDNVDVVSVLVSYQQQSRFSFFDAPDGGGWIGWIEWLWRDLRCSP